MQRYRINYHWLIGVFVSSLILAVVAFFVWSWQVNRKAGYFLTVAEQALADEKPLDAFEALRNYVQLRPDEIESRVKLGEAAIEVLASKEASREQRGQAFGTLDQSVRMTDDAELRRELAEIVINFRPQDAIGHVEELLVDDPGNPELNALLAKALFKFNDHERFVRLAYQLIGYDEKTDEFKEDKTDVVKQPEVYALLAQLLVQKNKNKELARRVIDAMVLTTPDSAQANLQKSIFLSGLGEKEEAAEFLDKAYELDPTGAAILSRKGMVALQEENYEEAKSYFVKGREEHPDAPYFYRFIADAELRMENIDEALRILDEGILEFEKQSVDLVLDKLQVLFGKKDYPTIDNEIERLTKWSQSQSNLQPIIDFQKARILYSKDQLGEAAKQLRRVRPLLLDRAQYQAMAGMMLALSYEKQGILDLALQTYKTILTDHPNHTGALKGRDRMIARLLPKKPSNEVNIDQLVDATLELPEAEQDWGKVDELVEQLIVENELTEARQKLFRAKVLIKRNMFNEAKELIRQAAKDAPDDIDIHYAAIMLVLTDPSQGPTAALKLLDNLEKKWGRTLRSRARRADLLVALKPEDVAVQLRELAADNEGMTEKEILHFDKILGVKFEQLNLIDDSREFYEKAVLAEPGNLPIRMHLFDLALRQRDDAAMQKAQDGILGLVGSKNNTSYILTEVKRQIMQFGRQEITPEELEKSRERLDAALEQRPEWHELHITYGQLLLLLREDTNLALQYFDKALEYGPARSNAVNIQVKLLYDRGLYTKARERMELLRPEIRSRVLGRLEAEILVKTGDEAEGFEKAKEFAASQPNNLEIQEWYSKLSQKMGDLDIAVESLRRALDLNPSDPDNWLRLIGLYAEQKKFREAEDVIREAHLSTDAEFLPLLSGKQYEMTSRWQMAEDLYQATYAGSDYEVSVAHRLADFYLFWTKKDPANLAKASIYINRILRAANEGLATADNPHVVWARQKAATILLAKKDYQQSLRAEQLLRQSAVNNVMSDEESALLTKILIERGDPASLLQAKQLLLDLQQEGRLQKKGAMQLASLLNRTNDWEAAKSLMFELLSSYKSDPNVRKLYVELLIDQGDYSAAEIGIRQLRDMNSRDPTWIQLSAQLAAEKGDTNELKKLLNSLAPKREGALSEAHLKSILSVAQLAAQYGANDIAEQLFTVYVARKPDQSYVLARFHAYHGNGDRAIEMMKRLYADHTDDVVKLANVMLSVRREEVGDKYDEQIDRLIDAALREDPDSITRQLARAEAYNSQGRYQESIAEYEKLLARDDLTKLMRAAAMNNLGFQLGLLNERVDEAEQLINDAMETFGPVEDMLDTRAVVRIAQGKYDLAIEDMQLALSVSRDPIKYFHMAKACHLSWRWTSGIGSVGQSSRIGLRKRRSSDTREENFRPDCPAD